MYIHRVVLVLILVLVGHSRADEVQNGLEQLHGSWEVVKRSAHEGIDLNFDFIVFKDTNLIIVRAFAQPEKCKIKINPTARPMQVDIVLNDDITLLGIYELKEDMLQLCFVNRLVIKDGKRPTEFKAREQIVLMTLKRQKK